MLFQEYVGNNIHRLQCVPPSYHSQIGTDLIRGVSGGERKRTNIGMELITDPSVLFLDEPTTGLDAFMAGQVIKTLKK